MFLSLPFGVSYLAADHQSVEATAPTPGFHIISLNASDRLDTDVSTYYAFPEDAAFYAMFAEYGGSLGLTIHDCSGENGTLRVWEVPPRLIEEFWYHGQALIALGSWHLTNTSGEYWGWFGNATRDWRDGLWEPSDGLLITHQNQTLGMAVLSLLYIVPDVIPEFSTIAVVVGVMAVMIVLIRRRGR